MYVCVCDLEAPYELDLVGDGSLNTNPRMSVLSTPTRLGVCFLMTTVFSTTGICTSLSFMSL